MVIKILLKHSFVIFLFIFFTFTAPAQKQMNDAQAEALKGKVKKVVTEMSKFVEQDGALVETERVQMNTVEFDISGNKIKTLSYWRGKPVSQTVYGIIEGQRYEKIEEISKPEGLLPGPIAASPTKQNPVQKKRDERYTRILKYLYDEKARRIKEDEFDNTGSLTKSSVYKYDDKGNLVERNWILFNEKQVISKQKTISTFDEKGNLIKTIWTLPTSSGDTSEITTTYEYTEFDDQGNWTRQIAKTAPLVRNGITIKSAPIAYYRKISYYE
jgi:hypothetical protein